MILRPAVAADAATFENFDLGDASAPHLTEVAEIVRDLWPWRHDPAAVELDRQVHVAGSNFSKSLRTGGGWPSTPG